MDQTETAVASSEIETRRHHRLGTMSAGFASGHVYRSLVGRYAKSKPDSFGTFCSRVTPATSRLYAACRESTQRVMTVHSTRLLC